MMPDKESPAAERNIIKIDLFMLKSKKVLRLICRFFGHKQPREKTAWERELKGEPFTWICSRCSQQYDD
jgi:hypothetical protein